MWIGFSGRLWVGIPAFLTEEMGLAMAQRRVVLVRLLFGIKRWPPESLKGVGFLRAGLPSFFQKWLQRVNPGKTPRISEAGCMLDLEFAREGWHVKQLDGRVARARPMSQVLPGRAFSGIRQ